MQNKKQHNKFNFNNVNKKLAKSYQRKFRNPQIRFSKNLSHRFCRKGSKDQMKDIENRKGLEVY